MSPQKQAAQIANAQKSHGATTDAGRARSSQNAIRHSLCSKKYLITPEERPEFDLYYSELIEALAPDGAIEALLAEAIILDEFRLTRARLVENQIFCRGYMSAKPEDQFISGAETWLAHSKELATLTLYEQRINRVLTRNKAEFESKQSARKASGADLLVCALPTTQSQSPEPPSLPAQPVESKPETALHQPNVGFVHSSAASSDNSSDGFVRSSAAPVAAPLPLTPAAKPEPLVPEPAADPVQSITDSNIGFVHSSSPITPPHESTAVAKPGSAPPKAVPRAA